MRLLRTGLRRFSGNDVGAVLETDARDETNREPKSDPSWRSRPGLSRQALLLVGRFVFIRDDAVPAQAPRPFEQLRFQVSTSQCPRLGRLGARNRVERFT